MVATLTLYWSYIYKLSKKYKNFKIQQVQGAGRCGRTEKIPL